MNQCIKCGKSIPDGELFCLECSLNPGSTLFDDRPRSERMAAPKGRMQTPAPVKRAPIQNTQPARGTQPTKKKSRRGLVAALVIVSLLLAAAVGMMVWQYGNLMVEKNRIRAKEADLDLRQTEIENLYDHLETLTATLDENKILIAAKEQEIQDLSKRLAESQSSQNQGAYDLTTAELELVRLENENKELLALVDDLEQQIDTLKKASAALEYELKDAESYKTKSDFLDTYVVFVENDGTYQYHTYNCTKFSKQTFWAYSRKLAEAQGFAPCTNCGGTP